MWNPLLLFRRPRYTENFLLVTYDSCRHDSYQAARTPILDAHTEARRAWSQATYTYASHASIFQGMLPHSFTEEAYYNRYVRQLWRQPHRKQGSVDARVVFPAGVKNLIEGFNRLRYFTCGTAAMGWFRHPSLREYWQAFQWTGINARRQVSWIKDQIFRHRRRPCFAFINFGETHSPYRFDESVAGTEGEAAARKARKGKRLTRQDWSFDEEGWRRQVACVEFLDAQMGDLLACFREIGKDVTVVMCGDHGDCFGEEGLYGHGFYHPRVMEVPLAIFEYPARQTAAG
ncbi:MAG: sulfatase-like hydrolase/transferase [Armatimonadetes bacterium]|nr:sulfatase-like hydrolase/transferase [Armatimonadota bacterium]